MGLLVIAVIGTDLIIRAFALYNGSFRDLYDGVSFMPALIGMFSSHTDDGTYRAWTA